jgi:hypothetical protein
MARLTGARPTTATRRRPSSELAAHDAQIGDVNGANSASTGMRAATE